MREKFLHHLKKFRFRFQMHLLLENGVAFLLLWASLFLASFSLGRVFPALGRLWLIGLGALSLADLIGRLWKIHRISLGEMARKLDNSFASQDLVQTAYFLMNQPAQSFGKPLFQRALLEMDHHPSPFSFGSPPIYLAPLVIFSLGLALALPSAPEIAPAPTLVLVPIEAGLPADGPPATKTKPGNSPSPMADPKVRKTLKKLLQKLKKQRREALFLRKLSQNPRIKKILARLPSKEAEIKKLLKDPGFRKRLGRALPNHFKTRLAKTPEEETKQLLQILKKLISQKRPSPALLASLEKKLALDFKGSGLANKGSSKGKGPLYERGNGLVNSHQIPLTIQLDQWSISPVYWKRLHGYFQFLRESE